MATNNTGKTDKKAYRESHSAPPRWQKPTLTGFSFSQCSNRKLYLIISGWVALLGIAVAASWPCRGSDGERAEMPAAFVKATAGGSVAGVASGDTAVKVTLCEEVGNSMPSSFRHTERNMISHAEWLRPAIEILARGERPLRVLHIGDSHVAGKAFPQAVKATLRKYLATEDDDKAESRLTYSFIGRNGATSQQMLGDSYMERFAEKQPDLIIVSLGTNEAHGRGYREETHTAQLDLFFEELKAVCPGAVVLLTTPPGDFFTTTRVVYTKRARGRGRRRTVRYTRSANPMSARCAALLAQYGEEHGMPVWNLFAICGGKNQAQRNWQLARLMRNDGVHFQPRGYEIQGKLLGEALARAFGGE